ncbi:uncharacterized protein LOC118439004 [Folsomia candida]|uniref:uncharacterized protein LOC118439004 n=1 Tax=Folsomia candida TaxID=158441 RepID=UPI00160505CC|nr:uncharacterized protein LOC118439004 [Folsomia candida]
MFHSSWKDKVLRCETAVCVATRILHVFRHLQHLKLSGIPALPLLNIEGIILPRLESLSTETTRGSLAHERFMPFLEINSPHKIGFANVTRLEFTLLGFCEPDDFKDLLNLLAPQLRHFCISRVRNVRSVCSPGTVMVPMLPKLKVFEIFRRESRDLTCSLSLKQDIILNFESARDGVKLVYGRQFPALEKLIVRVVPEDYVYDKLDKAAHFEATVVFLYETFLATGLEPCEMLRNFDVSIPTVDEVNVERKKRKRLCRCEYSGVEVCRYCSFMEDMSDIYDRIFTVFPRLEDHLIERERMKERSADIKMFKELAAKLGIFDGKDFNRIVKK